MKVTLPVLLSLNAGYVDTAGYLALHGLFTAHVTGNFVTFGAAVVEGSSGALAKLAALPVFCAVVAITRLFSYSLPRMGLSTLRTMLALKVLLLAIGALLAILLGPFPDADGWPLFATGMVLVAAMAIQNAIHRIHLGTAPPTTLMTGTTTQIMIDIADLVHRVSPELTQVAKARMARMTVSVLAFASGCAAGAVLYAQIGCWCFVVPPVLAAITVFRPTPTPVSSPESPRART